MNKVLLAGATGHLGKALLAELKRQGYQVRALVRDPEKARHLDGMADEWVVADATRPGTLAGICQGIDVVVSALGKSVSLQDRSKSSFYDVDFRGNSHLLEEAKRQGVSRFVYVSAFGAEKRRDLAYFGAHEAFVDELRGSGINYCVVRPPALFSALGEILDMARQGRAVVLGNGSPKTNPIAEADLAQVVVDAIPSFLTNIEAGGKNEYTRYQLTALACQALGRPRQRILKVPFWLVKALLPLVRLLDRNLYDKAAFMTAVCAEDCLAPRVGQRSLKAYYRERAAAAALPEPAAG
jgi:uncharacterized protein YbjT (DUF2867 family)